MAPKAPRKAKEPIRKPKRANGEGSLSQLKDGRWQARFWRIDPLTQERKRMAVYGRTKEEAGAKMRKAMHEIETGRFIDPNKITLATWINQWLDTYKKPVLKPSTYALYEMTFRTHIEPTLGKKTLQNLQTAEIQKLINYKAKNGKLDGSGGLSTRNLHLIHQIISGALKQAEKEQKVFRNVADAVELPSIKYTEIQPLTLEQVNNFLDVAKDSRHYAAFLLELTTGLRRGELLALRWADIDLEKGTLKVNQSLSRVAVQEADSKTQLIFQAPKTKKSQRTIKIPPDALKELKIHKVKQAEERLAKGSGYSDQGLVFCGSEGQPIDPRSFTRRYETLLEKAEVPKVSFHALRHTVAVLLIKAGEKVKNVQNLLVTKSSVQRWTFTPIISTTKRWKMYLTECNHSSVKNKKAHRIDGLCLARKVKSNGSTFRKFNVKSIVGISVGINPVLASL
ncbi:site-specific integrase [Heliobacterium chlorum]|uniref:Site-specific integrase n=1 Tax=Heliobacterium chlorum TaxID=2698 RepID=A0ABR7SZY4_HELCL|nr:tyrosine-type recombinase/integrase [Heliobacterium chlorum]MBC9784100.1 site-specific integrase [Heliobacterium chlorum]